MEDIKKTEDYMNMSLSISPEKYFDSRFDAQEKLFTEKFNGLQTQFNGLQTQFNGLQTQFNGLQSQIETMSDKFALDISKLDEKFEAKINSLDEKFETKIDALDKRLNFGFTIIISTLGVLTAGISILIALHFIK